MSQPKEYEDRHEHRRFVCWIFDLEGHRGQVLSKTGRVDVGQTHDPTSRPNLLGPIHLVYVLFYFI